ncbi:recombinase family protein [Nonomuraea sp. 3N208]|uniref:recombinase family protein n=1 Tax=Nonomuraea sp. 3N208 TaxID=3457421 RepID=UPI003FCEF810
MQRVSSGTPSLVGPVKQRELQPAVGYIRVSMLREEQISPAIQRDAIERAAARLGYYIARWIEDLDVSGRTFQRKIMDAIADVEKGAATAILVWKYSRFGRNRTGNQLNLARVESAAGQLISATEEVDARTAVGKLTRGMLMELAAFESDRAGEQWAEAFQNRLARGLPPLGGDYFGYVRRGRQPHPLYHDRTIANPADGPERYEPDVENGTAEILAECYQRWLEIRSHYKLAQWLNRRGIRTAGGAEWGESELAWMLDRGFGAGFISVHDPSCRCGKAPSCRKRVLHPGAHQPVISRETWDAYMAARKEGAQDRRRQRRNAPHIFSGFIICGHCRGGMHATSRKHMPGFICGARIRQGARTTGVQCNTVWVQRSLVTDAVLEVGLSRKRCNSILN